jgi:inorganic phosphate transporter, PiT family
MAVQLSGAVGLPSLFRRAFVRRGAIFYRRRLTIEFFYFSAVLIFIFLFITGFHDESTLIATIITSRSLRTILIFILAFLSQFAGTYFLGTKVARSMVYSLFDVARIGSDPRKVPTIICAAMLGAITWNLVTWVGRLPSSSSHAIIGGLLGPFILEFGFSVINLKGILFRVLLPLFLSPVIGFLFGYIIFRFSERFFKGCNIRVKKLFQGAQVSTCVLLNAFQGSNDAQKAIGIFALLLMMQNSSTRFSLSKGTILISALTISSGLLLGGMRMIKSVGTKIYSVKTFHSMCAQVSSLVVIGFASILGFPVSGTQIVNSSIFGVGAADHPNAVGWLYAKNMLIAWFITIPASFLISSGYYMILRVGR